MYILFTTEIDTNNICNETILYINTVFLNIYKKFQKWCIKISKIVNNVGVLYSNKKSMYSFVCALSNLNILSDLLQLVLSLEKTARKSLIQYMIISFACLTQKANFPTCLKV